MFETKRYFIQFRAGGISQIGQTGTCRESVYSIHDTQHWTTYDPFSGRTRIVPVADTVPYPVVGKRQQNGKKV